MLKSFVTWYDFKFKSTGSNFKKWPARFFDSIQSDNQNIEIYQLFKDAQLDDLSMDTILWWAYIETTIKNDNWDKRKIRNNWRI